MEPSEQQVTAATQCPPVAAQPFRFFTSLVLPEATGLRAATLPTLAKLLRTVPTSSVYHHTHHFILQHQYLTPEPTNDVAYWVAEVLGEEPLGELLASIDTMEYSSLEALREALAGTIERYLRQAPAARMKYVPAGREFFFMKAVHVTMPTRYTASTLAGFAAVLEQVSVRSLYYHIFEARLRLGHPTNDFSIWIGDQLGLAGLAKRLSGLDPYAHTLETLRTLMLALIRQHLERPDDHA